jgi:hypothetical protein
LQNEIVVSLCDHTANLLSPWADAGYQCYAIDIQHDGISTMGNVTKIGADIHGCISKWLPCGRRIKIAFGAPPCTHTAVSGAKYFRSKGPAGAAEAFGLIARCDQLLQWFDCPYLWEQPVATTSTYCGKPTHVFDPYMYAGYLDDPTTDAYTKRTCIWSGNGFRMPEPRPVEPVKVCPQGSWVQQLGGSSTRTKNLRSATPMGFARAVYEANK